jgi:hypothetical protein
MNGIERVGNGIEGAAGVKLEIESCMAAAVAGLMSRIAPFDGCLRANDALNIGDKIGIFSYVQSLKKLSRCLAVLQRLMWCKSNKLHNNLKIIYVIL